MKLIKKNYKFILGILIGVLLFGSGVYAGTLINSNEVTFTPQNNKWNVTKVDEALNSLYSVAVPEEYNGTTSITPTYNDMTLSTQDKLLKNDITISGIPSTYKNLTNTTTVTAGDIATGKTAYNSDGSLITGTALLGGDCTYGTYTLTSECTTTSGCVVFDGFNSNKFMIYIPTSTSYLYYYDNSIDANKFFYFTSKPAYGTDLVSNYFKIENNKLYAHNFASTNVSVKIIYIVCR